MTYLPSTSSVVAKGANPEKWLYFLHGIYGRGGNLRTLARRFVEQRPRLGVVLFDLRMHGNSMKAQPPHNLTTAAGDIAHFVDANLHSGKLVLIMGHSFGGKVALTVRRIESFKRLPVLIIDSSPSANLNGINDTSQMVIRVLNDMDKMPSSFAKREDFSNWMSERDYPDGVIQWLAMNVIAKDNHWAFSLDPLTMRSLLDSYFHEDLWDVVNESVFVLAAGRDSSIDEMSQKRLAKTPGLQFHRVKDAGHWLHIEAPDHVLETLVNTVDQLTNFVV